VNASVGTFEIMLAEARAEGAREERVASQKLMLWWIPLAWLSGAITAWGFITGVLGR
jgi:hypothetical protein